jgi:glucose/arabinose dehydrogenase
MTAQHRTGARRALAAASALALLGVVAPGAPAEAALAVTRVGGADRYETAVRVGADIGADGGTVVVATGTAFPDALAAVPLAYANGPAPVLLVGPSSVPPSVAADLTRRAPSRVIVVGGASAVPASVVAELDRLVPGPVVRVAGADRFATAAAVSAATFAPGVAVAYVVAGDAFADALAAGTAAAGEGPVLLVASDRVPDATAAELRGLRPGRIVVVGGPAVIGAAVVSALGSFTTGGVTRLSGPDRYATAAAVSAASHGSGAVAYLAAGDSFADALAGGVVAASRGAPMLLTARDCMPDATVEELARLGASQLVVVGGESAVGAAAAAQQPCSPPVPQVVQLSLVGRFEQPVEVLVGPGGATVVVERTGRLRRMDSRQVLLDVSARTVASGERGLLGAAFSPDGQYVYAHYTDLAGDTTVDEYRLGAGGVADAASRRLVLHVDQPYANHNGGQLVFGPDGLLYLGLGDGGSAGDPQNHAQDLGSLLGKVLRFDPRPSGGAAYRVPGDNPFVGVAGARGEVWAYGLRNPWRFTFDAATGDLWVGDVGQDSREEVDYGPAGSPLRGANLGWPYREGTQPYRGGGPATVGPLLDYPHTGGRCSITGGRVVRDPGLAWLAGAFVYGDFCAGNLQAARLTAGGGASVTDLGVAVPSLSGFGTDAAGHVYATSLNGPVYRIDQG